MIDPENKEIIFLKKTVDIIKERGKTRATPLPVAAPTASTPAAELAVALKEIPPPTPKPTVASNAQALPSYR
ncbi:MAG TPA: hypothetical protein VF585_03560 [Chthoniobacterales bacterium]|jgi:hypothetical protein